MTNLIDLRLRFMAAALMLLAIGADGMRSCQADDKKSAQAADPLEGEKNPSDAKAAGIALGLWELAYDYQGNQVVDRYEIKASESGELTGKLLRNDKEITKLQKIRVEDGKLTFEATGTTEGVDWKAVLSGTIMNDAIDGTAKITVNDQTYDLPWNPKRVKTEK